MTELRAVRPPLNNRPAPEPKKHVIAEYVHRTQTVSCDCGWVGSSESPDGRTSDWSRHLAENRTTPRR
jgi:hypothetical protein